MSAPAPKRELFQWNWDNSRREWKNSWLLDGSREDFDAFAREFEKAADLKHPVLVRPAKDGYESDGGMSKVQGESGRHAKVWKLGGAAPDASFTTITCKDGNIKGNELLLFCRDSTMQALDHFLPTEVLTSKLLRECDQDWAYPAAFYWCSLGQYAKFKTRIEASREFAPGKYTVGRSFVQLELKDDERVFKSCKTGSKMSERDWDSRSRAGICLIAHTAMWSASIPF